MIGLQYISRVSKLSLFFATIVFCVLSTKVEASHVVGGDITYVCLGGNMYQVKVTIRRDCFNGDPLATFDDPASVAIYTLDGTLLVDLADNGELFIDFAGKDTITNTLDSNCGVVGDPVCVEESVYVGIVELPYRPEGYILSYQRCCRNLTLNNIIDPLQTGSTYYIELTDMAQTSCNSSPEFNAWPEIYICTNDALVFDHSAIDAEGDSLVYKLCTPSTGASFDDPKPQPGSAPPYAEIQWAPGYGLNNMLGFGIPLSIDSETGIITATPDLVGQYLIGVCVEEYRDGVKISEVRRDFEYNARLCLDPLIAEVEPFDNFCDTLGFSFVRGIDNNGDNYEWIIEDSDGNVLLNLMNTDPEFTFPSEGIYTITLIETRDSDGCEVINMFDIPVFDRDYQIDFTADLLSCVEDSVIISLTDISTVLNPGETITDWIWTINSDGSITILNGPSVTVTVPDVNTNIELEVIFETTCSLVKSIDFDDSMLPIIEINGFTLNCVEGESFVQLYPDILNNPTGLIATQYNWVVNDGTNMFSFDTDTITLSMIDANSLEVSLSVEFENGCVVIANSINDLSDVNADLEILAEAISCMDGTYELILSAVLPSGLAIENYEWSIDLNGIITQSSLENPVINVGLGDNLAVDLNLVIDQDCSVNISQQINLDMVLPQADFDFEVLSCPTATSVELQIIDLSFVPAGMVSSDPEWIVDINGVTSTSTTIPTPFIVELSDVLIVTHSFDVGQNCRVSKMDTVDINTLLPDPTFEYSISDCTDPDGNIVVEFVNTSMIPGTTVSQVQWTYSIGGNVSVTFDNPLLVSTSFGEEISISLEVEFENGCKIESDTATVIQFVDPDVSIDLELLSCDVINDDYLMSANAVLSGSYTPQEYQWVVMVGVDQYTTSTMDIEFPVSEGEIIEVTLTLILGDQCSLTVSQIFDPQDGFPSQDIDLIVEDCSAGQTLSVVILDGNDTGITPIDSSIWIVDIDGTETTYNSLPQTIALDIDQVLTVTNFLFFADGCMQEYTEVFNGDDLTLDITYENPIEICLGDTIRYVVTNNSTSQDITVQWDEDTHILEDANTNMPLITFFPGETNFTITGTVSNQYGCDSTLVVDFTLGMIMEQMDFNFRIDDCGTTTVCFENTNPNASSYMWDFGLDGIDTDTSTLAEVCFTYPEIGEYTVTLSSTDTICAPLPISKTFFLDVTPELMADQDTVVNCLGGEVVLEATSNILEDEIVWFDEAGNEIGTGTTITVAPDGEEIYTAILTDVFGCADTVNIVAQLSMVSADILAEADFIYLCDTIELVVANPMDGETYEWSDGQTGESIFVNPTEDTEYILTVTDAFGCTATASFFLEVRQPVCNETDVFLPTAFSPNGDGNNDELFVRSNFVKEMQLMIYNRWGEQVFFSRLQSIGWDGTFRGEQLPPDTYGYSLMVVCPNDLMYTTKGNVSLIR